MTLQPQQIPRGCYREIRKYQACRGSSEACLNEKISIMEVCPDHILEALREKRKWILRAQSIDNETYKRAMTVADYNKSRSVSDLECKDWSYGTPKNLRGESTWSDDRYDPIKYSHPHRYDNTNFPEQEYKDVFGGTMGTAAGVERDHHELSIVSGLSTAMMQEQVKQRKIKSAATMVDELNKKSESG